jgi:hypothetical protein
MNAGLALPKRYGMQPALGMLAQHGKPSKRSLHGYASNLTGD